MSARFGPGTRLVVATHNKGKLAEFRDLLGPHGIDLVSAGELGLPEPAETGTLYAENAALKARAATDATGLPAIADDSGLAIDALDDQPARAEMGRRGTTREERHRVPGLQQARANEPTHRPHTHDSKSHRFPSSRFAGRGARYRQIPRAATAAGSASAAAAAVSIRRRRRPSARRWQDAWTWMSASRRASADGMR